MNNQRKMFVVAVAVGSLAARLARSDPPSSAPGAETATDRTVGGTCSSHAPDTQLDQLPLGARVPRPSNQLSGPHARGFRGFGFFPLDGLPPTPAATPSRGALEITLAVAANPAEGDHLAPALTVRNRTNGAVRVLGALDGSEAHWREPQIDFYLRDESDGRVYRFDFSGGRCGNTNAITEGDYHSLGPHAAIHDIGQGWVNFTEMTAPPRGRYTAWVTYRFCGFARDAGEHPSPLRMGTDVIHRDAVTGVFVSNAVTFEVR